MPDDAAALSGPGAGPPPEADRGSIQPVRIRPTQGWRALDLAEFWRHRELVWFLARRDVRLRYKQTVLGVAWAVIQPLSTLVVFAVVFGRLAQLPTGGAPYALATLAALPPWQLFSYALAQSSHSLVAEQRLITKVYFPRLVVPVASVLAGLVDLVVTLGLLAVLVATYDALGWYRFHPTWRLALLPAFVLCALATALALGLWLATLNVQYRDVRYVLPFLTQLMLFATPIAYPSGIFPAAVRPALGLNPMAGVVEGFRWAVLGTASPAWGLMGISACVVVAMLVSGLYYFRRVEPTFADWI
jgi:lipopolysaccharide transport system permease protein